ncbi:MAG TPA: NAD-dependent epimerase/dehydratase family protein [Gemmatimonadales bacterium]|nr:NAD-dependent epimerase/dehydratase family protein [Gemmatimonadales bacterium]
MDRVLVTGGTGFTGSHLVRHLIEAGHAVRVLARSAERARAILPGAAEIVEGDVTDPRAVARAVRGRDTVYHLAAAFREPGLPDARYREVHVDGTRHVLEAARADGVRRVVHCSTVGVHSHIEHPPADETAPFHPGDIYQTTKAEGERLALAFQREHAFPLTVVRPAGIYGPGDRRLLKLFKAVARRRFVMIGDGETLFHMVHVRDLVHGMRLAAASDAAIGEAFILAGPTYCTLNELVARIAAAFGVAPPRHHLPVWPFMAAGWLCEQIFVPLRRDPPIYRRRVAFFTKSRAFRIDKARRTLGYEPVVGLQEGIEETAAWYRRQGLA